MKEINSETFDDGVKEGLVLVDFYASWCGPCRMLSPILEEITDAEVVKVDTDDSPQLAVKYGVSALPTLILFKDGVEAGRRVGLCKKEDIQKLIGKHK
jgi:thioredoxin 1